VPDGTGRVDGLVCECGLQSFASGGSSAGAEKKKPESRKAGRTSSARSSKGRGRAGPNRGRLQRRTCCRRGAGRRRRTRGDEGGTRRRPRKPEGMQGPGMSASEAAVGRAEVRQRKADRFVQQRCSAESGARRGADRILRTAVSAAKNPGRLLCARDNCRARVSYTATGLVKFQIATKHKSPCIFDVFSVQLSLTSSLEFIFALITCEWNGSAGCAGICLTPCLHPPCVLSCADAGHACLFVPRICWEYGINYVSAPKAHVVNGRLPLPRCCLRPRGNARIYISLFSRVSPADGWTPGWLTGAPVDKSWPLLEDKAVHTNTKAAASRTPSRQLAVPVVAAWHPARTNSAGIHPPSRSRRASCQSFVRFAHSFPFLLSSLARSAAMRFLAAAVEQVAAVSPLRASRPVQCKRMPVLLAPGVRTRVTAAPRVFRRVIGAPPAQP
jgi:hypothetical protein